jgi:hypothetical protein
MHELIDRKGRSIRLASCVEEMSPEEWVAYCHLLLQLHAGGMDIKTFRYRLLQALLPQKYRYARWTVRDGDSQYTPPTQMEKAAILDSFFTVEEKDGGRSYIPNVDSGRNLLPRVKIGRRWWIGPSDMLSDLSIGEFMQCLPPPPSDASAGSPSFDEWLKDFFSVLYSPAPLFGKKSRRQGLGVLHRQKLARMDVAVAFGAYLFFTAVTKWITSVPIPINGRLVDFRCLFKSGEETATSDASGWTGVFFSIAHEGVFGTYEQAMSQDLYTVLLYLYRKVKESEDVKRLMKKR